MLRHQLSYTHRPALLVLLMLLFAGIASAQQYTGPGTSILPEHLPNEDEIRSSLTQAPWQVGGLRLSPWAGLRDIALVSYRDPLGETREDITATAGAGLRGYMKTGRRLIWAAHVLPEYVWWQDDANKESVNGRYGLGLFFYSNRLDVEVSARRSQRQSFFSSELQELTTNRQDTARLAVDLELRDQIFLYGKVQSSKLENQEDDNPIFSALDQEEDLASLEVRVIANSGWFVGVGASEKSVDSLPQARPLSHSGDSAFFNIGYQADKLDVHLNMARESLDPEPGSEFIGFETTTGALEANLEMQRGTSLFFYGRRQARLPIDLRSTTFISDRLGVRVTANPGRSALSFFAEAGEDDYTGFTRRLDDVTSLGLSLGFRRGVDFTLQAAWSEYDSNLAGFDREVLTWGLTVQLDALEEKLQIGEGDRLW